ncbi:hypothetical protein U8607_16595 [Methylobacterium durans]|uniref:hypothetical protein n=1 Tax=Methylobacterium durans TaxID=2202825 RepID=UPI002AFF2261|nr:hypothetical protein [Methylobacterium durans]MEA1833705.1 hypothetical protein [Methylobacterium durans]
MLRVALLGLSVTLSLLPACAARAEGAAPAPAAGANDTAKTDLKSSGEITGASRPSADPDAQGKEIPGTGIPADPQDRTKQGAARTEPR